jgi:hypothetical protein
MNYVIINYYLCVHFVLDSSEMSLILFVSLCMQFWRRTYLGALLCIICYIKKNSSVLYTNFLEKKFVCPKNLLLSGLKLFWGPILYHLLEMLNGLIVFVLLLMHRSTIFW